MRARERVRVRVRARAKGRGRGRGRGGLFGARNLLEMPRGLMVHAPCLVEIRMRYQICIVSMCRFAVVLLHACCSQTVLWRPLASLIAMHPKARIPTKHPEAT